MDMGASPDQSNIIETSSNGGKVKPREGGIVTSEQNSSGENHSPQTVQNKMIN